MKISIKVMLAKAAWDLTTQADKPWVKIFSSKYLSEVLFFKVFQRANDSNIWKGLLWTRDAL